MNRLQLIRMFAIVLALTAALSMANRTFARAKTPATGEEFFIVASIDQAKSQILLKHPTEVTMLLSVTKNTQIQDEDGKTLRFADLRAGDTVWVISSGTDVVRIRKGPMTVEELHLHYLDYPEVQ